MKNLKVDPLLFIVLAISILLGFYDKFLLAFLTVSFHEIGHLLAIKMGKIEISYIKIEPFGITIRLKNFFIKNYREEITVALFGPLFNFILALICFILLKERLMFFILSNLFMGLFNLLPAYPLDGGRILRALYTEKAGYIKSYSLVLKTTKAVSILLIISGVYLLYATRFNFSVCVIGCFLLFNLFKEKNQTCFYLLKEITSYKEKNKEIEKMPIKYVALNKDFKIRKILPELSFLNYHVFSVVEKGKITKTFTEGELIEGMIRLGGKAKICDLM